MVFFRCAFGAARRFLSAGRQALGLVTGFDNKNLKLINEVVNSESLFYNALTLSFLSDYKKLGKLKEKYKTWEAAWAAAGITAIDPEKEFGRLQKAGVKLVLRENAVFPTILKEIPLAPFGIYFRGALPKEKMSLAIVGTRKATPEGEESAYELSKSLAAENINIVSGLAMGVDAAAHKGAIKTGHTAAVLATGVDTPYPQLNKKLAENILSSGGALLSEYPLGSPPLPYRFLERNRIISGLSRATILIEAPERSGSLATARFALEQNRDIFVLPGPANHKNYRGSHSLIREGARLITGAEDILNDLGITDEKENIFSLSEPSEEENVILELVRANGPVSIDEIIETAKLDSAHTIRTVATLVLSKKIKEDEHGYKIC